MAFLSYYAGHTPTPWTVRLRRAVLYAIVFAPLLIPTVMGAPYPVPSEQVAIMRVAVAVAVGACVLLWFERRWIISSIMFAFYMCLIAGVTLFG